MSTLQTVKPSLADVTQKKRLESEAEPVPKLQSQNLEGGYLQTLWLLGGFRHQLSPIDCTPMS